uniref:Uncharacterized protein n=1 Tax=Anopheles culicifacies TaxID=139723 RepID=A0A182MCA7_9DIPT
MKRRVTIVYNPVQPSSNRHQPQQHGTLHQHPPPGPGTFPSGATLHSTTLASSSSASGPAAQHTFGSLCLSCMATSSNPTSTYRYTPTSSSSSSLSSSSSASFPCQRCCSISSILKSSPASSPSPLSASEKAAQIEDALNNNHHHQHHNHHHQRHQQQQQHQPHKPPSTDGCCAGRAECNAQRHPDQGWCMYLAVGLIAALCYLNGIQGDFVHDDIPAITLNKDVLGIGPVAQVFRNDFWGTPMADLSSHKSYRPLTTLTFR